MGTERICICGHYSSLHRRVFDGDGMICDGRVGTNNVECECDKLRLSPVLKLNDLRKANVERCETSFKHSINDWSPSDWAMATTGEFGELCNLLKKKHRGEEISQKEIADEIADTLIYLDLLAARLGVDLSRAVISKFNEVSDRVRSTIKL